MKNCVSFPKDLQQRVQKISLKIHQAISRFFFPSLMPRQKYSSHFSRATVFQHTSGEVFPPCRKLSRAGRSPVNRVICSLIKRVINSTGSRQALLKTRAPVHFACFVLSQRFAPYCHQIQQPSSFSYASCFFNLSLSIFPLLSFSFFFSFSFLFSSMHVFEFFFFARIRSSRFLFLHDRFRDGRINSWLNRAIREQRFMDYYGRDFREK